MHPCRPVRDVNRGVGRGFGGKNKKNKKNNGDKRRKKIDA
jgi:hypothetical protein